MTTPHPPKSDELELVSMYLDPPVVGAHGISLNLGPEHRDSRKGTLWLDPNHCGLDPWGDRAGCTKMAIRSMEITTTRTRLRDPAGHHRWLHRVSGPDLDREKVSLIEYPAAGLWYLVYERRDRGSFVVPLFPAKLFEAEPGRALGTRSAAAVHEVIERGDTEEMEIEARLLHGALEAIDDEPELPTGRSVADGHVAEVREALGALEAALTARRSEPAR